MTVTIDLEPEIAARLQEQARANALTLDAYIAKLVEEAAPPAGNQAAVDLLSSWEAEDVTEDAGEIDARRADWEALKAAMNASHASDRTLFP